MDDNMPYNIVCVNNISKLNGCKIDNLTLYKEYVAYTYDDNGFFYVIDDSNNFNRYLKHRFITKKEFRCLKLKNIS
jgi:hypothetical protein